MPKSALLRKYSLKSYASWTMLFCCLNKLFEGGHLVIWNIKTEIKEDWILKKYRYSCKTYKKGWAYKRCIFFPTNKWQLNSELLLLKLTIVKSFVLLQDPRSYNFQNSFLWRGVKLKENPRWFFLMFLVNSLRVNRYIKILTSYL